MPFFDFQGPSRGRGVCSAWRSEQCVLPASIPRCSHAGAAQRSGSRPRPRQAHRPRMLRPLPVWAQSAEIPVHLLGHLLRADCCWVQEGSSGGCRPCPRARRRRCRRRTARVPAFHPCTQAPVTGRPPSTQAKHPAWQGNEQSPCTHKAVPSSTSITEAITEFPEPARMSRLSPSAAVQVDARRQPGGHGPLPDGRQCGRGFARQRRPRPAAAAVLRQPAKCRGSQRGVPCHRDGEERAGGRAGGPRDGCPVAVAGKRPAFASGAAAGPHHRHAGRQATHEPIPDSHLASNIQLLQHMLCS